MKVKELIYKLSKLPKDLPVRIDCRYTSAEDEEGFEYNEWIVDVECSETGESGYETSGEVRLVTSI